MQVFIFLLLATTVYGQASMDMDSCALQNGACEDGILVDQKTAENVTECQVSCAENPACNLFTFESTTNNCLQYSDCNGFSNTNCPAQDSCVSAYSQCSCMVQGQCEGVASGAINAPFLHFCLVQCEIDDACTWWTYDPVDSFCVLWRNCSRIEAPACPECLMGEKACYQQEIEDAEVLLVTAGFSTNHQFDASVELIPLDSQYMECPEVPDVPDAGGYGKGFVYESHPVMCPANDNRECYIFNATQGEWQLFVELNEARPGAAGVQLGQDYVVLGGGNSKNSTELFKAPEMAFSKSFDMPYGASLHCVISPNKDEVTITGGESLGLALTNVSLFSINTEVWLPLPDLQFPRDRHSCGIVQPYDGSPFLAVVGGYSNPDYYSSSEILSLTPFSEWSPGVDFPLGTLHSATSVAFGNSFLLVGGSVDGHDNPSQLIFEYDPYGEDTPWKQRPEQLAVARNFAPVAIIMKAREMGCLLSGI